MKIILALLTLGSLFLAGCAADGSARIGFRVPIGESAKYGTALIDLGYVPPERFSNILNSPTLRDK